ncbi:MAG: ECF transporter S component [Butyrivibrio sp.]|nr:ECF transporter S component [Butyrivibrio sp.]
MGRVQTQAKASSLRQASRVKWIALTGIFMAFNIIMSSFGIPVPGGHLYLCDAIICTAALLLDPVAAFIVGGIGSFLGDMLFYPAPMFVSLVTHGLQAVAISLIASRGKNETQLKHFSSSLIGTLVGAVIMVVGYTLGKTFVYSTFEYAMIKLPYEIAQALLGAVASLLLYYKAGLGKIFQKMEFNS